MAEISALALRPGLLATMLKHLLTAKAKLSVAVFMLRLLTSCAVVTVESVGSSCRGNTDVMGKCPVSSLGAGKATGNANRV